MKKRSPLLTLPHHLALVSCAGAGLFLTSLAGLFLTSLTPSCDPEAGVREGTRQRRAFVAAERAVTGETAGAARQEAGERNKTKAAEEAAEAEWRAQTPEGMAVRLGFEKAARIKAARRAFLTTYLEWRPHDAPEAAKAARDYRVSRTKWKEAILNKNTQVIVEVDVDIVMRHRNREEFDRLAESAVASMLPNYQNQWKAWEAKEWDGYKGSVSDSEGSDSRDGFALFDTLADARNAALGPVLDEQEFLDDVQKRLPGNIEGWDTDVPAGPEQDALVSEWHRRLKGIGRKINSVLEEYPPMNVTGG